MIEAVSETGQMPEGADDTERTQSTAPADYDAGHEADEPADTQAITPDEVKREGYILTVGPHQYRARTVNFGLCRQFHQRQTSAFTKAQEGDIDLFVEATMLPYDLLFEPLDKAPKLLDVMDGLDLGDPVLERIRQRCEFFLDEFKKRFEPLVSVNRDLQE